MKTTGHPRLLSVVPTELEKIIQEIETLRMKKN